jgi:hypothetical protein
MADFLYPENSVLTEVAQEKTATMAQADPLDEFIPIENIDSHLVEWEQEDNWVGLQQVRGINGAPPRVKATGAKRYAMQPGVYGEFEPIDELELTTRRKLGMFGTPVSINDLVGKRQDKLLSRQYDRINQIRWTLVTTGTFAVVNADNVVMHTDTFTLQTFTATVPWATYATATPLADLRAVQLLAVGKGVRFDSTSVLFLNRITLNDMLKNANAADLAGRRTNGLNTLLALNLAELNTILAGEDLPQIRVQDDGYVNDAGTFVPYIANAKATVIGRRIDGNPIGKYLMTRNANNPESAPGEYSKVKDEAIPRLIEVHQGHNGGPALMFPSAIVKMNV